jgi:hypothetical protein
MTYNRHGFIRREIGFDVNGQKVMYLSFSFKLGSKRQ